MAPLFDVEAAMSELRSKPIEDIERSTAKTWAGRAAAAFRLAASAEGDKRQAWLMDGENYRQEALEHAAMTGDFAFLQELHAALETERGLGGHPRRGR